MAENFIFLQSQFPNEKIIGWGASYHFANELNNFEYTATTEKQITKLHNLTKKLASHSDLTLEEEISGVQELEYAIPMGKLLKEHYGKELYSIGFTSYNGNYLGSHDVEFPVLPPPKNSIESVLFEKKIRSSINRQKRISERYFLFVYFRVSAYLC